ncbi:transporter [Paenibacillus oryzae]|uniref:Transporter n=1 Tax=Paenibacillus oryzae TaxID=1844972 RepID=A0A1A5YEF6_9BACL|nr:MFS transporter [Paenibacillus oryzae]OBR63785.1 transporter [Paenibacillus oryzae]
MMIRHSYSTLSPLLLLILALSSGLSVANIYFAQPLLDSISGEFNIPLSSVGFVVTATQIFYAAGLVLLVPVGDIVNRRKLIVIQMLLSAGALLAVGLSPTSLILFAGIGIVGLLAVAAQTMVAAAAALSRPSERGKTVGVVTGGIVIGILLARTVAGLLNDWLGWRSVYLFSSVLTLMAAIALFILLPKENATRARIGYGGMIISLFLLYKELPVLRIRALLAMFLFMAFSTLWTAMVLPLSSSPLSLSHTAIGAFGLAGAAGAFAAAYAGRLSDRGWSGKVTGYALGLLLLAWLPISLVYHSILFLIIGVVLLDLAVQAVHVTNQSLIYKARPEAQSRLTAAYMIFYSIGSAAGSIFSTQMYAWFGWEGVCWLGGAVSGLALLTWLYEQLSKEVSQPSSTFTSS